MTHFLKDILRQPEELERTIEYLCRPRLPALVAAAEAVRGARHVYLTGIGSSWHAALNVSVLFHQHAYPVYLHDAAELLAFAAFPKDSAMILISRSGKSTEIVQLAAKARKAGVTLIGITNVPEGTLAKAAHHAIVIPIALDHAISVSTYTTLALATGMLANSVVAGSTTTPGCAPRDGALETTQVRVPVLPDPATLADLLSRAFSEAARSIPGWQEQIASSGWLKLHSSTYFLARGSSLGSAYEARLMWEEGVKTPATAMGTGSFRHGPQEIVAPAGASPAETADKAMRFGIWMDGVQMRDQDLALARDLGKLGARVMLIGQKLPEDASDLVFQLPAIPAGWQFLIDIIPAQLVAERLAGVSGVDCDTFRLASYVVDDEGGLLPKENKS